MERNPWTGVDTWKEFKHDVTHMRQFGGRVVAGMKGENPDLDPVMRWIGFSMVVMGAAQVITGIAMVVR